MKEVFIGPAQRFPLLHCPRCGHLIDGATPVAAGPRTSKARGGDMTFCLYCAAALVFEESIATPSGYSLRVVSAADLAGIGSARPESRHLFDVVNHAVQKLAAKNRKGRGQG